MRLNCVIPAYLEMPQEPRGALYKMNDREKKKYEGNYQTENRLPDYHMHTALCKHAKGVPAEYRLAAKRLGIPEICFVDHAPTRTVTTGTIG